MMKKSIIFPFTITLFTTCLLASCNNGPKVIQPEETSSNSTSSSGIFNTTESNDTGFNQQPTGTSFTEDLHQVVVQDILPTQKYVYLKVTEAGKDFWIATGKQEINKGGTYFYKGGLLKTRFESKEYNRMFDTIYLVTNIVPANHGNGSSVDNLSELNTTPSETTPTETPKNNNITPQEGSITIAEIVDNPQKYEGKTVQITGKCTKINPQIMNRNWIHLKDGSKDDYDLVVTSTQFVAEGKVVTMKATVSLNRDFGAGYTYELILENGTIVE